MSLQNLRIFVSSPGDVAEERILAARVIERLKDEFANRVKLEPIFWEHEPLRATETFQKQITKPSETDIVISILWSRLGTRLPSDITRPDGTRYRSGTEFEFEDAVDAHRRHGVPDLLVYRKMAEPLVSLKDKNTLLKRINQKEALDNFVNKWFHDSEEGTLVAAFHPFETTADFEELLEIHLRKLIQNRLPKITADQIAPAVSPSWTKGSPFRGLEVFDYEHAPIFFGRTKAIGEVINALRKQAADGRAFVLVLGMSGCGKSSLVRAGVLPLLTQPGVIEGVSLWRKSIVRLGISSGGLIEDLASALLLEDALPELVADGSTARELAKIIGENPKGVFLLVKGALSQAAAELKIKENLAQQPEIRLVFVIDQLEEMFTIERITNNERKVFLEAISALACSGKVWIISTLRSDFYPRCTELPDLVELKEGNGQYDLISPSVAEIGQIIRQPAIAANLKFEEDPETNARLDDVLRDKAASDPTSLPLLEFALEELYKKSTCTGELTHAAYKEFDGIEGAIAQRAENIFQNLSSEVQATFPDVLRTLVKIGNQEDETATRKRSPMDVVCKSSQAKALVDAYVKARLFVADLVKDGTAVVSISHEALLHHWPRLQRWLIENREFLRTCAKVAVAYAQWLEEGKSPEFLLARGKPLADGDQLLSGGGENLEAELAEYIKASIKKRKQERRKKTLVGGAVFLFVFILAIFSTVQWRSSLALSKKMEQKLYFSGITLINGYIEKRNYDLSQQLLWKTPENMRNWEWGYLLRLCNLDLATFSESKRGRELSYLNRRAFNSDGSKLVIQSGNNAKIWDLITGDQIISLVGHQNELISAEFSPDGSKIITASLVGAIVWDAITGDKFILGERSSYFQKATFSSDGLRIVTAYTDGTVMIREASTGDLLNIFSVGGTKANLQYLEISSDGSRLAAASTSGDSKIYDISNLDEIATLQGSGDGGTQRLLAFSPDGLKIASQGWVWDAFTGEKLFSLNKHYGEVNSVGINVRINSVEFSPDGLLILTSSNDKTAKIWDASTGKELYTLAGHLGRVHSASFSPDGSRVVTASSDKYIKIWDVSKGVELTTLRGHSSAVMKAIYSPNGAMIASLSLNGNVKLWDAVLNVNSHLLERKRRGEIRTQITVKSSTNEMITLLNDRQVPFEWAKFNKDCLSVVTLPGAGKITSWDVFTGAKSLVFDVSTGSTGQARFYPKISRLLIRYGDRLEIWNSQTNALIRTIINNNRRVLTFDLSPNGTRVSTKTVVMDKNRIPQYLEVKVLDASTGKLLSTLKEPYRASFRNVSNPFSPDGSKILIESFQNSRFLSKVWDISNGEFLFSLEHTQNPLEVATFSPNGSLILTVAVARNKTNVWDATTGAELYSLDGQLYSVDSQLKSTVSNVISPNVVCSPETGHVELS